MKTEDVRVGMILRDHSGFDWTVVGIDDGTLRVVSVVNPIRIVHGANPANMLDPIPANTPVDEPEPEAEADTYHETLRGLAEWGSTMAALELERDELKAKLVDAEKQAEQARRLWASWREQKQVLAELDVEFGGKP